MLELIKEKVVIMLNACEGRVYKEMAKFGADMSSKYGISPSTAISLILGFVCLYMLGRRLWEPKPKSKPKPKPVLERSKSLANIYGGDFALRRLEDHNIAKAIPYVFERSDLVLKGLLEEEHLDLKKLQSVMARLEMAGKEEEGVKLLKEAKEKNIQLEKSHHVYEIDMLLVEMLIYLGKHDEAKSCECLKHQEMMLLDARRPLFKAIIYGMREDWITAESFWRKFEDMREDIMKMVGQEGPCPEIKGFENFKEEIQHLHNQIDHKSQRSDLILKRLLQDQHPDLNKLLSVITRPDMAGSMGDEGVKLLREAAERRRAEARKSFDVNDIEMLLVELLIYQGKPDEALKCQCLNPENALDARRPLFKN
ncbi:uncharacterized protein LOC129287027 isoform X2 [Prosopis cineraria]|uniref:uncharacterized protein LOC129287027 isoform X2 n=1 Tax=Prosopis cineraria TaxID=364024 RepID=UPI0024101B72|nr:uncharacterized protein LOC129287027 isoform X2 [Prosopis cineraria]